MALIMARCPLFAAHSPVAGLNIGQRLDFGTAASAKALPRMLYLPEISASRFCTRILEHRLRDGDIHAPLEERRSKLLQNLAAAEGFETTDALIQSAIMDSMCPAICRSPQACLLRGKVDHQRCTTAGPTDFSI
jgi:hypothetical protein